LQQAVKEANQALQRVSPGLEFSLEQGSDRVIVRVVDSETDEILLQIPSEQMLAISRALDDLRGLLFEQEA
jgi:flagellar protein FlaG